MLAGKLALVTGGTGFLGRRIVEALLERGVRVRIATSNPDSTNRLARLPVATVQADLKDHNASARAVDGCDLVFHLAYAFGADQRRTNFEGTRALAQAARRNNVSRFVHFGSVASYGRQPDGDLDERATSNANDAYAEAKRDIDALLLDMHRADGFPAAILQPAIVYGPDGGTWTTRLLAQVRTQRVGLPKMGRGICNAVYVDDVVAAALLADERPEAVGEAFLVSGPSPVTWEAFYSAYAEMVGRQSIVLLEDSAFDDALRQRYGQIRFLQKYRRGLEKLIDRIRAPSIDAIWLPDPGTRALYGSRTIVRSDKARRHLGFAPAVDLADGMQKVADWARMQRQL